MRIDSPIMTNAEITGSFSGSFEGTITSTIVADSVEYANVLNKPTLVSGSSQITISDTTGYTSFSASIASDIAGLDSDYATDAELNASSSALTTAYTNADTTLSASIASDIAAIDTAVPAIIDNAGTPAFNTGITKAEVLSILNVEDGADVTDTTNVTAAGALMDSEVSSLSGVKSLTVPDSTTISTFGATLVDDADAATARTTLGVDAAGTDNSTDVTLVTTSHDYLSLSGQAITLGTVDISDDTNLATGTGVTLTGDTLSIGQDVATTADVTFATASISQDLAVGGNVTVTGNLSVLGDAVEIQVGSLSIEDKNILVASGAADSATADGAGITIGGANESITWDHANSRFNVSDDLHVVGNVTLTGTADGRDLATDGSKLDGIEANADVTDTANVTAAGALMDSEVDADIKTLSLPANTTISAFGATLVDDADAATARTTLGVDAAGTDNSTDVTLAGSLDYITISGQTITRNAIDLTTDVTGVLPSANLDADTMHLGVAQAITANKTFNDNVKAIFGTGGDLEIYHDGLNSTIKDGGTGVLELQTNGTELQLTGNSGTEYMARFISNGAVNLYYDNGLKLATTTGGINVTGGINATGDISAYSSSDRELKDNITPIPNALEKVEAMGGYVFDWNDKQDVYTGHDIGVVAQEVEAVLPEIVATRDNGYKAVKYEKLTAVLIQAVKELSARVQELEKK